MSTTLHDILERSLYRKVMTAVEKANSEDEKLVDFSDDPLAIMCANLKVSAAPLFEIQAPITQEDRAKANAIRKYYSDRFAFAILRGQQLSEFRMKLYGFLQGHTKLKKKDLGLLYKLPHFYQEDMALENLIKDPEIKMPDPIKRDTHGVLTLKPKTSYHTARKNVEGTHFWYIIESTNYLVDWFAPAKMPHFSLIQGLFNLNRPIRVEARYNLSVLHLMKEFAYYRITNPTLVLNETAFC